MNTRLETNRLYFRPFELNDAQDMHEMDKNPNVHKYLWQKPSLDIQESKDAILYLQKQYKENGIGRYATFLKENDQFIGWTGIKFINDHIENGNTNFFDYGYRLNEIFWNNGYATEATYFWLKYGFEVMKIKEMNAYTHAENGASNHVLSKCGMNFMENYYDKDGVLWKWWLLKNQNI